MTDGSASRKRKRTKPGNRAKCSIHGCFKPAALESFIDDPDMYDVNYYDRFARRELFLCYEHEQRLVQASIENHQSRGRRCIWPGCKTYVAPADKAQGSVFCAAHSMIFLDRLADDPRTFQRVAELRDRMDAFNERKATDFAEELAARRRAWEKENDPKQGIVYMIRPSNGAFVKIGWTSDLSRRLREYPPDTPVLAVMPGTMADEQRLHKRFAHLRSARREWYPAVAPQIVEQVRSIVAKHGPAPTYEEVMGDETGVPMTNRINKRTGPTPRGWTGVA